MTSKLVKRILEILLFFSSKSLHLSKTLIQRLESKLHQGTPFGLNIELVKHHFGSLLDNPQRLATLSTSEFIFLDFVLNHLGLQNYRACLISNTENKSKEVNRAAADLILKSVTSKDKVSQVNQVLYKDQSFRAIFTKYLAGVLEYNIGKANNYVLTELQKRLDDFKNLNAILEKTDFSDLQENLFAINTKKHAAELGELCLLINNQLSEIYGKCGKSETEFNKVICAIKDRNENVYKTFPHLSYQLHNINNALDKIEKLISSKESDIKSEQEVTSDDSIHYFNLFKAAFIPHFDMSYAIRLAGQRMTGIDDFFYKLTDLEKLQELRDRAIIDLKSSGNTLVEEKKGIEERLKRDKELKQTKKKEKGDDIKKTKFERFLKFEEVQEMWAKIRELESLITREAGKENKLFREKITELKGSEMQAIVDFIKANKRLVVRSFFLTSERQGNNHFCQQKTHFGVRL